MGPLFRRTVLLWLALAAAAWGLAILVTGGGVWWLGPLRITSRDALRPVLVAAALAAAHVYRAGRAGALKDLREVVAAATRPRSLAAIAAVAAFAIGAGLGTRGIGGSDSYGYMSEARQWLQGDLTVEQPFVAQLPWPNAPDSLAPLGYRPIDTAGTIVPVYAPGFPLLLAPFLLLEGLEAEFLVVPFMAAAGVWLTFVLGRQVQGEAAGVIAALLLLGSPTFLFMLVAAPMSDIPAMTWWLVAIVAALGSWRGAAVASGLATAMAILTRPNLAPLAALLPALFVLSTSDRRAAMRRGLAWLAPALAGPVAVALINHRLYGLPTAAGYGDVSRMFSPSFIWPNVERYTGWLLQTQTPLILGALVAPLAAWLQGARRTAAACAWCLLFAAATVAAYLAYTVFGAWWFLRFLLPALPPLLVLAAVALVLVTARLGRAAVPLRLVLVLLATGWGVEFARRQAVFTTGAGELRYRVAGERVRSLPRNAVVLAVEHSGSVRYYAGLLTVRYDFVPPDWLDRAVAHFEGEGRPVYAVLDCLEVDVVRDHFRGQHSVRWLDYTPFMALPHGVEVFRVSGREP